MLKYNHNLMCKKIIRYLLYGGKINMRKGHKLKINWMKIRTRAEEILELILFLLGIVLTVLISSGILSWGAFGIGICALLIFIGASRFVATNSWSDNHNDNNKDKIYSFIDKSYDDDEEHQYLTKFIFSIGGSVISVVLIGLVLFSVLSPILGFAIGVPILSASIVGVINGTCLSCNERFNRWMPEISDNYWGICIGISGIVATATVLSLGFAGILSLSTAIALVIPLFIFSFTIGLIFLAMFVISKTDPKTLENLKNILKNDKNEISFLGLGYFAMKTDEGNEEPGKPKIQEIDKKSILKN